MRSVTCSYGKQGEGSLRPVGLTWVIARNLLGGILTEGMLQVKGTKVGMPVVFRNRNSPSLCVGRNRTGRWERRLIEDTEVTEPKWSFRVDLASMCSDGSEWGESGGKESS